MESYYESRPGDPAGTYYYFDGKRPVMKREGGRWFNSAGIDVTEEITRDSSNEANPPPPESWDENRYRLTRALGDGTQASVGEYQDAVTGRSYAIKHYQIEPQSYSDERPNIIREIAIMSTLSQDEDAIAHMVRLIRWHEAPETGSIWLVMHPVASQGRLLDILLRQLKSSSCESIVGTSFTEEALRNLARGLAAIHTHTVRHKDINTENILIHRGQAIYSDFGISLYHDARNASFTDAPTESPLTENTYAAPELLDGMPRSPKSDVFSLGCVIWEMLVAQSVALLKRKDYVAETAFGNFWEDVKGDGYAKQLRRKLLTAAFDRMRAEDGMRQYRWIVDVIERMTRYDPGERISASGAYELTLAYERARGVSDSDWVWKLALEEHERFVEGKFTGKFGPLSQAGDVYHGQGTVPA